MIIAIYLYNLFFYVFAETFLLSWRNFIFTKPFFYVFSKLFDVAKLFLFGKTSFGETAFGELHFAKLHLAIHFLALPGTTLAPPEALIFFKLPDKQLDKHTLTQLYYRLCDFENLYHINFKFE